MRRMALVVPSVLLLQLQAGCAFMQGQPHQGTRPPAGTGAGVFYEYCARCHGEKGDGNGVAAKLYDPRPANLTVSTYSDSDTETIIRDGGKAVGRSAGMPPWGSELNDAEIKSVVLFLHTLKADRR